MMKNPHLTSEAGSYRELILSMETDRSQDETPAQPLVFGEDEGHDRS